MKKRYTEDQIIGAVKRLEAGQLPKELSRELGVLAIKLECHFLLSRR